MKPLQFLRNHAVAIVAIIALGFAGWLAYDSCQTPEPFDAGKMTPFQSAKVLPPPPMPPGQREPRPGIVTADLLPRLQPGMARVEVEELIGAPPAKLVYPVANVEGRFIYRASYLANLDPMIEGGLRGPIPRSTISLDYDAGRVGHPLVKVHVADNMS
ncbi:MAG TPA: hypothetical protein VGI99_11855 [Gemmataceae bacterium]|jgi:hypothetical protein